jgi:hypothetical protein
MKASDLVRTREDFRVIINEDDFGFVQQMRG